MILELLESVPSSMGSSEPSKDPEDDESYSDPISSAPSSEIGSLCPVFASITI